MKFLAAVDITQMTELVDVLKNFAEEIVEPKVQQTASCYKQGKEKS